MGWWGEVRDTIAPEQWQDDIGTLLRAHPTALIVGCDLHL